MTFPSIQALRSPASRSIDAALTIDRHILMHISWLPNGLMPVTARLFTNGRSLAVRLPKGFRFEGVREVSLEREGEAIILRPVPQRSIETLIESLSKFENMPEREQPTHGDRREAL